VKRIYVSGPMTGIPEHNFPAFNAESARLRALGYEVVNPVDINPDPGTPWNECLKADLRALLDCDTIALLPGWEGSKGAHLEVHVAHRVGITITACGAITS
jgi:DNA primase